MVTTVVAIPNALAEYSAPLKPGSTDVSALGFPGTLVCSIRAAAGTVVVGLGRGIGEGPTLRFGGGALVKACAARCRLSKTMGTLRATADIPSYDALRDRQRD